MAQTDQDQMGELVLGSDRKGFTLIEMLIVLGILGLILSVGVPQIGNLFPGSSRKTFFSELNKLIAYAWQNAIREQKTQKVIFDLEKNVVSVEAATDQKDVKGQEIFQKPKAFYFSTEINWPESLQVRNFYIEGTDMAKYKKMWFFIVPDGLSQSIVINLVDLQDEIDGKPAQFGLVLNPFQPEFKIYDIFQKP